MIFCWLYSVSSCCHTPGGNDLGGLSSVVEDEAGAGTAGIVVGGVVAAGGEGQFCHMEIKHAVCTLSVVSSSILKLWVPVATPVWNLFIQSRMC